MSNMIRKSLAPLPLLRAPHVPPYRKVAWKDVYKATKISNHKG